MKWGAVGRRRLLKLAEHLESGTLGHKEFNFSVFNIDVDEFDTKGCGLAGCAIGELPIIFPELWCFAPAPVFVLLRSKPSSDVFCDAARFFGITHIESGQLFTPYDVRPWAEEILEETATRLQVAESIRQFIPWKDKQES